MIFQMKEKDKIKDMDVHPYPKSKEDIFKDILNTINNFISNFQKKDRLEYLYEADIQASLAYELSKSIDNVELSLHRDNPEIPRKKEKLSLITREYPIGSRFDIACINAKTIKDYFNWRYDINEDEPIGDNTFFWELPLIAGIEIKYSPLESNLNMGGIKSDVEKFNNYQKNYHEKRNGQDGEFTFTKDFKYIALQFYQDEIWLDKCIKKEANGTLSQVDKFEFNDIFLISKNKFLKYRV